MEAESTNSPEQFDPIEWFTANAKMIGIVVGVVLIAGVGFALSGQMKEKGEIKANEQLFALPSIGLSKANGSAENYLAAARDNSGNPVGERAELLAAGVLFNQGKFGEAQAQFEKCSKNSDSTVQAAAAIGIAACLESQNKVNEAIAKYQDVVNKFGTTAAGSQAKLSLARLLESQKPEEAFKYYEQLDKSQNPYDPWRSVAMDKREELLAKHPELTPKAPQINAPQEQIIEVTTPPEGSTNAPIVRTNVVPAAP